MKRYFSLLVVIVCALSASAQIYNNEWIDYSKTYYKFNVGANGVYRMTGSTLASAGLGSVQAQYFQLWRNGVEVPVYTSVSSGVLAGSDYIEFYGLMNDGSTDTKLYKYDSLQMNPKWSLYTDTAAYFLTVNSSSANKRIVSAVNNVAGNVLPVEPYFMYTLSKYFKQRMNQGFGYDLGELVSSASYEQAEGWSSNNIGSGAKITDNNAAIRLYSSGPTASLEAVVAGNTYTNRTCNIKIDGTQVATTTINAYGINKVSVSGIPLTTFTSDAANIDFVNAVATATDQMVAASYAVKYPRTFNFNGQSQFNFELAATANGYYLEISNFVYGATAPVLYDLTNNIRYTAVVASSLVKFALPSSDSTRKFVLLSIDPTKIFSVSKFQQRNFINYADPGNQGDYLIISHPLLFDDGAGNNYVESYRSYRSSPEGGNFNAKIIDINQLTDQFAFGVKHHPLSIRNFSYYASSLFAATPKYFFLIGKGLNYQAFHNNEADKNVSKLALVPTFGTPSSDNLLVATRTGEFPMIPIGRLSAITGSEINIYLEKVKEYDQAQRSASQTIEDKGWMKNVAEVTGGLSDPSLAALITSYMQSYEKICSDTLFGAKVYQYSSNSGSNTAIGTDKSMDSLINEGVSLITYFGHSSPNTIEFNLDNPENYHNKGKYPLMVINGCLSGDLFQFDTLRYVSKGTLSEKFVFASEKGSIGYIASTHYGLPTQLNYFNTQFYKNFTSDMYGESLGNILKETMKSVITDYAADYIAQTHVEEITLHGDPAVVLNAHAKPDYIITDDLLSFNPSIISVADDKVTVKAKIHNIGKAVGDSVRVKILFTTPENNVSTVFNAKIRSIKSEDSVVIILPLNPLVNKGVNEVTVIVDPDNLISELSETNNTVTKSFTVIDKEIRPIFPYEYSIVNDASPVLYASTANPEASEEMYVMEFDTSALFNSASKIVKTVLSTGGIVSFTPGITLTDSGVYYWRVALGPVVPDTRWLSSSFVYINGIETGFNQSHYYQFKNDDFASVFLDSNSRKFSFISTRKKLLTRVGDYPYYDWDQNNVNLDIDQIDSYGCKYNSIQFYVFDSASLKPWDNYNVTASAGRFGSVAVCDKPIRHFFEFDLASQNSRRSAMNFFDSIPNGAVIHIRNLMISTFTAGLVNTWKADTSVFGSGISLWHKFQQYGLTMIDSFSKAYPFVFTFKKGYPEEMINQEVGTALNAQIVNSFFVNGSQTEGTIVTPWMGPAKKWNNFKWDEIDPSATAEREFDIIGKNTLGNEVVLARVHNSKDTSVSFIDAKIYPYLKLRMYTRDTLQVVPTQLKYWMLTGDLYPEGAVSPNIKYQFQESLTVNDTLHFKVAFKNISSSNFDSIKVRLTITDRDGIQHIYNNLQSGKKLIPLNPEDSVIISYDIPAFDFYGANQFYLDVNPDYDQPEQFHFNNVLYSNFFVTLVAICPNSSTTLYSGNKNSSNTYKWQVDEGNGYINLSNGGIYSGIKSDALTISNATTTLYGNKYRCAITNNSVTTYSAEYRLKFAMKWTGSIDNAWENPANWSCNSIPDEFTDVIIESGLTNYPVINSNAAARSITAGSGATLTVNSGFDLKIAGTD